MGLRATSVSKCLDKKLIIFGFEVIDILAIFLLLSILNFLFGSTHMKLALIWLPSAVLALCLYFGKRGKPDNYLVHWLRFQIKPGTYSAFHDLNNWKSPPKLKSSPMRSNKSFDLRRA